MMTTSYEITVPSRLGGAPEKKLDLQRFATDLAAAIGGEAKPFTGEFDSDRYRIASIELGREVINLAAQDWGADKGKVHLSIYAGDVPSGPKGGQYATPRITVSPGRPMAALARDVQRRLIDAAEPALAKQREYKAANDAFKLALADNAKRLERLVPGMRVSFVRDEPSARFDMAGAYLSGRVNADGTFTVDRMASINLETLAVIAAALTKETE